MSDLLYNVKYSWNFSLSLNASENVFMAAPVVAEIGDLLVYSFSESGGRLAIDATSGIYSDYKILDGKLQGKIDQNENYRFSVLVNTGPIVKYDAQYYIKSYVYPGTYTLTAWLDNKGPFKLNWKA